MHHKNFIELYVLFNCCCVSDVVIGADIDQKEFPVHISELVKGNTKKTNHTPKTSRQFSSSTQPSINARRGKLKLSLSVDQGIIKHN